MVPLGSEAERRCDLNLVALCPQRPPTLYFSASFPSSFWIPPSVCTQLSPHRPCSCPVPSLLFFFPIRGGRDGLFTLKQGSATITVFFYRIQLNRCNKLLFRKVYFRKQLVSGFYACPPKHHSQFLLAVAHMN